MVIHALQGDTVEAICWRVFRKTAGITEQVLSMNPGLARFGAVLPEGTPVLLPAQAQDAPTKKLIQLWN
jgi:phage tail protein X